MIFNYTCPWRNLLKTAPVKLYLNQRACQMNGMKRLMFYSSYSTDSEDAVEYLVQLSGCTKKKAESVCKKRSLNIEDIKSSYAFLNKVGEIQNLSKYLRVLLTHPMTLENHYLILEEIGIRKSRMNLKSLNRFYPILNSSQSRLKELGYLDEDANVMQNCLSHAELPDNVEMNILQDIGEKLQSEDVMVAIIHRCVMSLLLRNKLQNSSTNYFSVHERLNFKSLRYISSSYDILTRRFGIPVQRVLNNTTLLCASPSNMEAIIDDIPKLGGIETKEMVKLLPKIVFSDCSSLIRINECLEKYNISPETVLKAPMVFTLRSETVEERLHKFKTNPDLNLWSFHPQMLRTVLYQRKVLKRVDKLKENNLKCSSLYLLQCDESYFNMRTEGLDKTGGADVVWMLMKQLDADSIDADSIRSKLRRHPHWLYVPLTSIKATLDFLLERKFTKEEIYKSLLILLYPRNIVEQELDKLSSQDGIECCKQGNELRQDTILPLTLYFIEHQHHFSPEAIWSYGNSVDYEKQTEATNDDRNQYIMTNT